MTQAGYLLPLREKYAFAYLKSDKGGGLHELE